MQMKDMHKQKKCSNLKVLLCKIFRPHSNNCCFLHLPLISLLSLKHLQEGAGTNKQGTKVHQDVYRPPSMHVLVAKLIFRFSIPFILNIGVAFTVTHC